LYGTSVEHHVLYQYNIQSASNIVAGFIQTETVYFQPNPPASIPFPIKAGWQDPYINTDPSAGPTTMSGWGLSIGNNSQNINIYGVGLYSFFRNNVVNCSNEGNGQYCQERNFLTQATGRINVYNLNMLGVTNMISQLQPGGNPAIADLAKYSDNLDGYVNTIAIFRPKLS
jgi:glucan 1,3-beta-glucosidase